MYKTYKSMKPIAQMLDKKLKDLELEDLAEKYQEYPDSTIFAYCFVEHFGVIKIISDKFYYISNSDKSSFVLEELHKCLMEFDKRKGNFRAMYSTYVKNRLRHETQKINYQKRKTIHISDSLDRLQEDEGFDYSVTNFEIDKIELIETIKSSKLEKREKDYAILLVENESITNRHASNLLGIKENIVPYLKIKIKKELKNICTLSSF